MMRSRFDEQLTQLNNSLIEMGALIEQAIAKAVKAFEEQDVESAQKIIENDDIIDDKEKEIEGLCLKLLMNLRHIPQMATATIKMVTDSIDAFVKKDLAMAQAITRSILPSGSYSPLRASIRIRRFYRREEKNPRYNAFIYLIAR
ncbi:hypothetical protein FACS189491_09860 [Spirochaetia bacterium]|nr:hypothetical protein FACS189491_09860 [Spirochaetia bacterium]